MLPLFLFTFLFVDCISIAQNKKIDSLLSILKIAKEDTGKVNILDELSYSYRNRQPDTGLLYGQQALALAEKLNWRLGIATSYSRIGNNYYSLSSPYEALEYFQKALKIYEQTGDKAGMGGSFGNIGTVYQYFLSDYLMALEYHEKSLRLFEQLHDKNGIAKSLGNLAIIHEVLGDYPKALENFQQAITIHEQLGNKEDMAVNFANMGIFYDDMDDYPKALEYCKKALNIFEKVGNNVGIANALVSIGNIHVDLSDYENALKYFQKSINMFEQMGEKSGTAKTLGNIGLVYANSHDFPKALEYFKKSFDANSEIGNRSGMASTLISIGDIYLSTPDSLLERINVSMNERYSRALEKLTDALEIANEIGELDLQQEALKRLSVVYEKQKSFASAYKTYQNYIVIRDSILNDEKKKEITHKEIKYEYDKKEAVLKAEQEKKDALAVAEIKRQTLIKNATLAGVSLAAIFSFMLIWSFNRRRKAAFDKQVAEVEMKALRSQMNPHFIFNSLHSINKYMMDNDRHNASEYLTKFSKLMRLILENSRQQEVILEKDLSALELYMQLEALRFQNKFQYSIEVDAEIDKENTLIPPLMLQPFVENSIIHGVQNKEGGLIKINITRTENNMIRCVVEDNGSGMEEPPVTEHEQQSEDKRTSLGIKIMQERLNIINQLKKVKAAVQIFNLRDAKNKPGGLRIELLLPLQPAF